MANKKDINTDIDVINSEPKKEKRVKPKKDKIKVSKETKKAIKVKKKKEKKDLKLALKEMPIKVVKEANKIKWSGWDNLKKKYVIVLLFMIIFAVLFFVLGMGIEALFHWAKIF